MGSSQIYGIAGKRRHGKDTLAKMVVEIDPEFKVLHFAGHLKEICMKVFNLTYDQCWTEAGKEAPFASGVQMDNFLPALCEATGLNIQPKNKWADSAREILQYVGTDYVRSASDTYWIDCLGDKIKAAGGKVLIPDTRYPNEAEFLRKLGAYIVKVERQGMEANDKASQHTSETSIDMIEADVKVTVPEGKLEILKVFAQVLADPQGINQLKVRNNAMIQLEAIVTGFNESFHLWEDHWKMGANVSIDYHSLQGRKLWFVADVQPALYQKPEESVLASVGEIIKRMAGDGTIDELVNKAYAKTTDSK